VPLDGGGGGGATEVVGLGGLVVGFTIVQGQSESKISK
jgi:hypothetical protein